MALHITKGNGAPSIAPVEIGQHYIDEQNGVHYLSVGNSSVDDWVQVAEGGGATNFLQLLDTPSSYAGQANRTVRVNASANGLEFVNQLFVELFDTPSSYSGFGSFIVRVKPDETGVEFVPSSAGSLPPGGTAGQLLIKIDATDGNATWQDLDSQAAITSLDSRVSTNESNIGTNTTNISTNASNIATNTSDISTNAGNISTNTGAISNLDTGKEDKANKGIAGGYAPLSGDSRVPKLNLPLDIQYTDAKSQALGYASLDASARVPKVELPTDVVYDADLGDILVTRKWEVFVDQEIGADTIEPGRGALNKPFATIKAAVDYVATLGTQSGFSITINVSAGNYVELPFVMPDFISLIGTPDFNTAIIPAVDSTDPLVTIGTFSNINNFNFNGTVAGVGPNYSGAAIFAPAIFGCSIQNLLVNFWTKGIEITGSGSGGTSRADCVMANIACGQFGAVDRPIILSGGVTIESTAMFFFSDATTTMEISDGAKFFCSGGLVGGGQTAFAIDSSTLQISNVIVEKVNTIMQTNGTCSVIFTDANVSGNGSDEGFKLSGSGGIIQIADITAVGFTNIFHTQQSSQNIYINACQFNVSGANSKALFIESFPNVQVKNCSFLTNSLDGTIAFDCGNFGVDYPFVDINDSFFFNFQDSIVQRTGQATIRHCTFEVFAGPPDGTSGVKASGDANCIIEQCNFLVGEGVSAVDQSLVRLGSARFFNNLFDFRQRDQAIIFTTQSNFNEDKISAENWAGITGNFNSTKVGDRGLICTDKLKVGVPEIGRTTSLGEGAAFSRGMLVYTYDPATDEYTDVSENARDITLPSVGIPNVIPGSAIYIGCELVDENLESILFNGLNVTIDQVADYGNGSVISEIWNGTSWQAVRQMITEAQPPFRQINIGNFNSDNEYNLRLPNTVEADWERSDPIVPPLNRQLYWFRTRVASDWFDSAWLYRRTITIPAASVSGTLEVFPVYIDLATMPASFWTNVNVDGSDIRITDGEGVNQIAQQLVAFDRTGQTGQLFFSASELSNAQDNEYFIYYGNPLADPIDELGQFGRVRVWRRYDAVYHLEDGTSGFVDATINNYTATVEGTITEEPGKFGNAIQTANDPADCLTLPNNPTINDPGNVVTHECWFTKNDTDKRRAVSLSSIQTQTNRDDFFGIWANSQIGFDYNATNLYNAGANVADGAWHHAVLTFDGVSIRGYLDGVEVFSSAASADVQVTTFPLRIANRGNKSGTFQWGLNSLIDNVRIIRAARSSQWIATQYSNQNNPASFYQIGSEETEGAEARSEPIVTPATYKQIRLWPNCTVMNTDGYLEYFGKARPVISLPSNIRDLVDSAGTNIPVQGQDVWYTKDFGVKSNYRYPDSINTRATLTSIIDERVDVSSRIIIRIHFVPRGTGSGAILFRVTFATSDGEVQYYTNPDDAPSLALNQDNEFVLANISEDQNNRDEFVDINIDLPLTSDRQNFQSRADLFWATIERVGSSTLDTYQGPIDLIVVKTFATAWCDGNHTLFL